MHVHFLAAAGRDAPAAGSRAVPHLNAGRSRTRHAARLPLHDAAQRERCTTGGAAGRRGCAMRGSTIGVMLTAATVLVRAVPTEPRGKVAVATDSAPIPYCTGFHDRNTMSTRAASETRGTHRARRGTHRARRHGTLATLHKLLQFGFLAALISRQITPRRAAPDREANPRFHSIYVISQLICNLHTRNS